MQCQLIQTFSSPQDRTTTYQIIFDKHQFVFSIIRNSYEQHYNESRWRIHSRYFDKITRSLIRQQTIQVLEKRGKETNKAFKPFQNNRNPPYIQIEEPKDIPLRSLLGYSILSRQLSTPLGICRLLSLKIIFDELRFKFSDHRGRLSVE